METKFLIILMLGSCLCYGQESKELEQYRGTKHTAGETRTQVKAKLIKWWSNFESSAKRRMIDSLSSASADRLEFAGEIPVKYTMYGATSDGGIVKFKLRFTITDSDIEFLIYDAKHVATPGVKHKDGGSIFQDKPLKGSMIFGKTWKSYRDQTFTIIHEIEGDLNKQF